MSFNPSFKTYLIGFLLCFAPWGVMAQTDVAGYVTRVRGDVFAASAPQQKIALGDALHVGDTLRTGGNARLEARMEDGMIMTLGENTEFVVRQMMGVTPDSKNSVFGLIKGVFQSATRASPTGQKPTEPCRVETPVATIGIRGTELWGGFNLLNAGGHTLDVVMIEGRGVYVESAGQRTELKQAGEGTTVKDQATAPTPIKKWGKPKLDAAFATVAW